MISKDITKHLEYLDDTHTYLYGGVIIPSVSELCTHATGKCFDDIPKSILEAKAEYGTQVHQAIEDYEKGLEVVADSPYLKAALREHTELRDMYANHNLIMEQIVAYKGQYAGRLDILADPYLVDIKTTYSADIEWLEWQLGYYRLALSDMGVFPNKFYLEWLPKGKMGKLIEITPKTDKELLDNLESYKKEKEL